MLTKDELNKYVNQAKQGNAEAVGILYDAFIEKIFAYIYYRTGNRASAEDLTGEVFLKMVDKIEQFRGDSPAFVKWLFTITKNHLATYYRSRAAFHVDNVIEMPDAFDPADDPEARLLRAEREVELAALLSTLPEEQQNVITLRFYLDFSVRETAVYMNKSEGAVKQLQHRALLSLNRKMVALNDENN